MMKERNNMCQMMARLAIVVLMCVTTLTSCHDYEPFSDHDLMTFTYEKDFVNIFGKPDPNHQWGFVNQPMMEVPFLATRGTDTDKNHWYANYHANLNIPGYPDHLHHYFRGDKVVDLSTGEYKKTYDDEFVAEKMKNDPNWLMNYVGAPVGDVTQEERDFVYNWLSTNKTPISTPIHWDSYFIQYVDSYKDRNPQATPARNLDQLRSKDIKGNEEHINNFNGSTVDIMYHFNCGTESWSYQDSHLGQRVENAYTLVHLVFDIPQSDCPHGCTIHHYDGWYLAFDYNSVKGDANDVKGDGYYNDWIFKVTPGNEVGYPETVRVMCEDLGAISDWDFNDVVFDVSFRNYSGKVFACIAVQAAGGTLPICVGVNDPKYEVHKLLGDGSMTPIIHPATFAYYEFEYTDNYNEDNTACAKSIPIFVNNSEEAIYYTITNERTITNGNIAQKFACPDYVQWTEERQNITELYPDFSAWVQNSSKDVWRSVINGSHGVNQNNNGQGGNVTPSTPVVPEIPAEEPTDEPTDEPTVDYSSLGTSVNLQAAKSDPATVKISDILAVKSSGSVTITFLCQSNNTDGSVYLSKDGSSIAWGSNLPAATFTKQAALSNGLYPIVVTLSADALNTDEFKDYYLAIRIYENKQVEAIYVK